MKSIKEIIKDVIFLTIPTLFIILLMLVVIGLFIYSAMIVPEIKPIKLDINICENYANSDKVEIKYLKGEKYYYFLGRNYTETQIKEDCLKNDTD